MHNVTKGVAALHSSQHRHHRGDTGSAGQEQHRGRRGVTHGEVAPRSGQTNNRSGPHSRNEVGGQETLRHGLDGDGDGACTAVAGGRRQRIGPPPPAAVDEQADPDVLPGLVVEAKAPSGLDHQGGRVAGLGADLDDPAAEFAGGPQRIDELEVVVRQQWSGDPAEQGAHRGADRDLGAHATYGTVTCAVAGCYFRAGRAGMATPGSRTRPGHDPGRHPRSARRPRRPDPRSR